MRLHIFRTGNHVASSGEALAFSDADLKASAEAYDPAKHEAPIVVGHPKTDSPAYGWVGAVSYADGDLYAQSKDVDPAFAELVAKRRYKKVSASFYRPDSPSNPVPGVYYLRHVGFLGATPPAVKGLKNPEFAGSDADVVEFAWSERENALLWRGLRDWLIEKFSLEEADRVVPPWTVASLEAGAARETPSFSDPTKETSDVDQAELQRRKAELDAREAEQKKREAEFAERERKLKADELAANQRQASEYVGALVASGKILPRHRSRLTALLVGLPSEEIEFAEGDTQVKRAPADVLRELLDALPPQIDYSERAGGDRRPPPASALPPREVGRRARAKVAEASKAGRTLTFTEAVDEVLAEGAPE